MGIWDEAAIHRQLPYTSYNVKLAADLKYYLHSVNWDMEWLLNFNTSKTKLLSFNYLREPFLPSLNMAGVSVKESDSVPFLANISTDMK